jgi:hypothetical protein
MKLLTIAIVAVMLALLPAYSHAMASKHHRARRGPPRGIPRGRPRQGPRAPEAFCSWRPVSPRSGDIRPEVVHHEKAGKTVGAT